MKPKVILHSSEEDWMGTGEFKVGYKVINDNRIKYAVVSPSLNVKPHLLVTMVGGIPRDPLRRKNLPLINKLYGLLAIQLAEYGIASLMYNHPGTGGSEGVWEHETFVTRSDTLVKLMTSVGYDLGIHSHSLMGSSAGAYIATMALDNTHGYGQMIKSLVLLSPAAYPKQAENLPYGADFTRVITGSWQEVLSPIFERLCRFVDQNEGRLLVCFFEKDDPPIPTSIQKLFQNLVDIRLFYGYGVSFMIIEGVSHNFHRLSRRPRQSFIDNDSIKHTAEEIKVFLTGA